MATSEQSLENQTVETTRIAIAETVISEEVISEERGGEDVSGAGDRYVGQWNRLISTTNWEKGRIICQWREALMTSGAAVTDYSDEAWAQLVGGVSSQHVGRLRRVCQRFGDTFDQYEGLYWSHFQASLDWDDAEMWLEGSLQSHWSVSQMRGKRWEALGTPPEEQRVEEEDVVEEVVGEDASDAETASVLEPSATVDSASSPTTSVGSPEEKLHGESDAAAKESAVTSEDAVQAAPKRTRLSVDVESLPDDLAEAFEQFKLAIIAHRREEWRDTTPESVVECLESLKELALAE